MRSRIIWLLGRAVIPGLLVAIALSSEQVISVQIWIAAGAVWVGALLVRDLLSVSAVERARLVVPWRRSSGPPPDRNTPKDMLALGALLANATRNPRAHTSQLRPELIELANHFVPLRYGFSPPDDPDRMRRILGDDWWLIDPATTDRTPTVAELHRYLDAIMDDRSRMVTS